ncbi:MAG: FAD:protein FMN transferase, partial [Cellvibrionaceae bacterium]
MALLLFGLVACEQRSDNTPTPLFLSGSTMGTTYSMTIIDPPAGLATVTLQKQVDDVLKDINQQMSTYIDDAEIMKFNRAEVDQWQPISASFLEVLTLSQGLAALTEGRFDITIGPL